MLEQLQAVHQPRPRHRIVHEAAGEELAARSVVHRQLAEHLARALRQAALHLSLDDLVIDDVARVVAGDVGDDFGGAGLGLDLHLGDVAAVGKSGAEFVLVRDVEGDRKSTRLNSSHSQISYAVFCLKKKKIEWKS